jgi:hypothetical protein
VQFQKWRITDKWERIKEAVLPAVRFGVKLAIRDIASVAGAISWKAMLDPYSFRRISGQSKQG